MVYAWNEIGWFAFRFDFGKATIKSVCINDRTSRFKLNTDPNVSINKVHEHTRRQIYNTFSLQDRFSTY